MRAECAGTRMAERFKDGRDKREINPACPRYVKRPAAVRCRCHHAAPVGRAAKQLIFGQMEAVSPYSAGKARVARNQKPQMPLPANTGKPVRKGCTVGSVIIAVEDKGTARETASDGQRIGVALTACNINRAPHPGAAANLMTDWRQGLDHDGLIPHSSLKPPAPE